MALEEAGFNTNFTSMYWTFASGFPKAANMGKMADKRLGTVSTVIGTEQFKGNASRLKGNASRRDWDDQGRGGTFTPVYERKVGASAEGKKLQGSYAGFQPKPAVEVIIVAMKPLSEKTFVDQALKNGKGITWLDDCRVPSNAPINIHHAPTGTFAGGKQERGSLKNYYNNELGRFPGNLLVDDGVLGDYSRFFAYPFIISAKASKSEKNRGPRRVPGTVYGFSA
jgi:hypothetical protein